MVPYLCFLADNVPNAVWVWDIQKLKLFVALEHLSPVRSFQWDPQQPRLAICTGGSKVYLWSPAGCVSVQVPGEGEHIPAIRHGGSSAKPTAACSRDMPPTPMAFSKLAGPCLVCNLTGDLLPQLYRLWLYQSGLTRILT